MKIKKLAKSIIPAKFMGHIQRYKMYSYRLNVLEQEIKNKWLLEHDGNSDQKENLRRHEFKIYSQTGEDGIINYIFNKIGTTNKKFLEIGVEDGQECNTANLSLNFGWSGVLIEGNKKLANRAKNFYALKPVEVVNSFVTRENINETISKTNVKDKIDLLSIDIDGNDYWIWDSIDSIKPRVVIVEYNSILGNSPISVAYKPNFQRIKEHPSGFYYGASLAAFSKLADRKGYILVGCCSSGFNAFFVDKREAKGKFVAVKPEEADHLPNGKELCEKRFNIIKYMPFEKV